MHFKEQLVVNSLSVTLLRPSPTAPSSPPRHPVLLLHGWLGTSACLHDLAHRLCSAGHLVLVPDLPYHGDSFLTPSPSPLVAAHSLATTAASTLTAMGRSPEAIVAGYSLGGRIALELASAETDLRVLSLILLSSGLAQSTTSAAKIALRRAQSHADSLKTASRACGLRDWLRNYWYAAELWGGLKKDPAFEGLLYARERSLLKGFAGSPGHVPPRVAAAATAAVHFSASAMTPGTVVPAGIRVLYVYGELDAKYASVASEISVRVAPHAFVSCIRGCGHNVVFQDLESTASVLVRFISPVAQGFCTPFVLHDMWLKPYSLPLKKPMRVGSQDVTCRKGVLVVLSGECSAVGVGDIAPLPGLHVESLESSVESVRAWFGMIMEKKAGSLTGGNNGLWNEFGVSFLRETRGESAASGFGTRAASNNLNSLPSSANSAICAALLQCIAHVNGLKTDEFLRAAWQVYSTSAATVIYNDVAPRPRADVDIESSCREWLNLRKRSKGQAKVFKLKVAFSEVEADAAVVNTLSSSLRHTGDTLRLDANCSWTTSQFFSFCNLIQGCLDVLEYAEEPVLLRNPSELELICQNLYSPSGDSRGVLVGLDESLAQFPIDEVVGMLAIPGVGAAVLKPSAHKHISRLVVIARAAQRYGVKVVLSSVFDSGVGLAWACLLASVLGDSPSAAHGIGTFKALEDDVITPGFSEACVSELESSVSVDKCLQLLQRTASSVMSTECAI